MGLNLSKKGRSPYILNDENMFLLMDELYNLSGIDKKYI